MDHSTFRGSINVVLDGLKRMFPDKQIVMMTPIHRGAASFGEDNVQPTEDHQNGCGEYLDAYIDSIKEASALWSVPVIDLYSLSGIYPMHEEQAIYVPGGTDWLHPNEKGHRRMAQCIYHQLLALPCVFDDMR
jgi:lysophospholipase L1-like esterase